MDRLTDRLHPTRLLWDNRGGWERRKENAMGFAGNACTRVIGRCDASVSRQTTFVSTLKRCSDQWGNGGSRASRPPCMLGCASGCKHFESAFRSTRCVSRGYQKEKKHGYLTWTDCRQKTSAAEEGCVCVCNVCTCIWVHVYIMCVWRGG